MTRSSSLIRVKRKSCSSDACLPVFDRNARLYLNLNMKLSSSDGHDFRVRKYRTGTTFLHPGVSSKILSCALRPPLVSWSKLENLPSSALFGNHAPESFPPT